MNIRAITVLFVFLAFFSCETKEEGSSTHNADAHTPDESAKSELGAPTMPFDWSLTQRLKSRLLGELERDPKNSDKSVVRFLEDYAKIEKDFNEILFNLSDYDSLNTLAYAPKGGIYEKALKLKEQAEANGFVIAQAEGMIYLAPKGDYIKSGLTEVLGSTSISKEFIDLYCQEMDSPCCADGGILLSEELLVERASRWGNLLEKVEGLEYESMAESSFQKYLLLIYSGLDNSPSFDRATGVFNEDLLGMMNKELSAYPNSRGSSAFKEFIGVLEQSGFKRTEQVDAYLQGLMK